MISMQSARHLRSCQAEVFSMSASVQARFPLLAREASSGTNTTNETATQAGGPYRWRLPANLTGKQAKLHNR